MNSLKPHSLLFVFAILSGGVLLVNEPHRALAATVDAPTNAPIPWDQIGAKAGADYQGDGLRVVAQGGNVKLNCVFQRLEGEATPEGLWLTSTVTNQVQDRFRVVAASLGRTEAPANPTGYGVRQSSGALVGETHGKRQETAAVQDAIALTPAGTVSVDGQTVRYARPGVVEEYTVSMDGVRQDFVVLEKPLFRPDGHSLPTAEGRGEGNNPVALNWTGALATPTGYGVRQSSGALVGETPGKRQETAAVQDAIALTPTGTISVDGQTVRYARPGVVEEYTVSMDGVRQDFVVLEPPLSRPDGHSFPTAEGRGEGNDPVALNRTRAFANPTGYGVRQSSGALVGETPGKRQETAAVQDAIARAEDSGELRLELAVSGARVERTATGAQLVLAESGRKIAYSRLRVTDATGRELTARLEVASGILPDVEGGHPATRKETGANDAGLEFPDGLAVASVSSAGLGSPALRQAGMPAATTLAILVNDTDAVYPVRIDPTFSDANWISMGGVPGADNYVYAAVVDGSGNLYIGGYFKFAGGVEANCVAKWDGSSWSALGSGMRGGDEFNLPFVRALAMDDNGDLYAGGYFETAGGVAVNQIAKWNGSSWSALDSGIDGAVLALAVDGNGNLYAGGSFGTAGGVTANEIAKWDGSKWSALGSGVDYEVRALAVDGNGNLYAGGYFETAGGVAVNQIAKWDGNSWSALDTGVGYVVYALAVAGNGDLYAGGRFETAGGVAASYIAKWDGSSWSALGAGMDHIVTALAVADNGDVYAGGSFETAGGVAANAIAKWDGNSWSALGAQVDYIVSALAVADNGGLYAGGSFGTAGGVAANNIAKWDGSRWSALGGTGMNGGVQALVAAGDDLYAGGGFTMVGGITVNRIAKWDGSSWSALGTGMDDLVEALALAPNGDLYAGGRFTTAGGVTVNRIAKWDGSNWSALGAGMNNWVHALAVAGSDLYAGGQFTTAGGVLANYIARWDGSSWHALGAGMNNWVHALAVSGNNLYVGGFFYTAGGMSANRVAKWDGNNWTVLGMGLNDPVLTLAVVGNNLYAGGEFHAAGGVAANFIAKWDGSKWSALGSGMNNSVYALAVSGSDLYAGGYFTTAGGVTANYIAKWDGNSWSALGSGMDNVLYALAVSGDNLYAGGSFATAGGKISPHLARAVLGETLTPIPLQWQLQNQQLVLSWTNSNFQLQAAPDATGTYTNVPNATSPYTNPLTGPRRFFRLKAP
ncbi:MAG: hypothetical protein M9920_10200 [Verrucomicrobiae bacterium]|nr:hypothetical protein [Verrucomicrobiae bacterium]